MTKKKIVLANSRITHRMELYLATILRKKKTKTLTVLHIQLQKAVYFMTVQEGKCVVS